MAFKSEWAVLRLIVMCLMIAGASSLAGQSDVSPNLLRDTVFHKSGLTYYGTITQYEKYGKVRLKGPRGWAIQFERKNIQGIGWSARSLAKFRDEAVSLDSIPTVDVVYLKDGSVLRGTILQYERGDHLLIKISSGEIKVLEGDIEKIVQEPKDPLVSMVMERPKKPKVYAFREHGFYGTTVFALMPGGGEYRSQMGLSLQTSFGYQLSRHFGAGVGVALDGYANNNGGDTFLPLFAEARGYILKKKTTPYWVVAAGYGIPLHTDSDNQEVRRFEGGYMFHPAIGYRLGADKTINLTLDIGYKFQKAITEREFFFSGDIITREVLYRRLSMRMSVIF